MNESLQGFIKTLLGSLRDLTPIVLVIGFFQLAVIQQPIDNIAEIGVGLFLVVLGLTFFIYGLEMGLFPAERGWLMRLRKKAVCLG